MTFIEAAKKVLIDNGNKPLTSREIWDSIEKNDLVKTSGKTPHLSMNSILCGYSSNLEEIVPDRKPRTESEVKNSIFRIVSQSPYKFVIDNYILSSVKQAMIKNGFITIDILKEILKKNNIDINID